MITAPGYFITGTDTEVGKTYTTAHLLRGLRAQGLRAVGMKPIAAGTMLIAGEMRNEDVEILCAASAPAPRALINPYCFDEPIAPHIAAAQAGVEIRIPHILDCYQQLAAQFEHVLVEGVGGFRVPLGPNTDTAQLAQALALPVILVVGMRLGCLNHALLTAEAILARGLHLAGWVANCITPDMPRLSENLAALDTRLPAPRLLTLPYQR